MDFSNDKFYRKFKREYLKAVDEKKKQFTVEFEKEKYELVTDFAKYCLQYAEESRQGRGMGIYTDAQARYANEKN